MIKNKKTQWDKLKEIINKSIGQVITRQEILKRSMSKQFPKKFYLNTSSIDSYLNILIRLNVIERVDRGKYFVRRSIGSHVTTKDAQRYAYGESWQQWFNDL